ncbi:piggyBac transposable element-derived protein 4 isoform X1 [Papilio machaon]|uniref:piggyBac transposable element-derived protein 4 isoform X1 n=2 Tax=Papilio machaon TaxID=76193 RepID=UPI001E665835|nr:piggyBac transposable element-derived protein 4 isoform X1 [Papilio machaon]
MTTAEELIRILEGEENEEFIPDEDFDFDEEVHTGNVAATDINWTTQISPPVLEEFDEFICGVSPDIALDSDSSELQFFEKFCDIDLVQKIVDCTNKYHQQFVRHTDLRVYSRLQRWQDATTEDIYIVLALTMLFTRNKRITIEEHWSTDPLLHSAVFHNTMYRNRYCSIIAMLCFYEVTARASDTSRLQKIKMMIDHAREKFKSTFMPGRKLCIDESIVPFKGRLVMKQYLPKKRNRFGIKLFVLCDVKTGYIVDFIVYCGVETQVELLQNLGLTGSVVNELLKDYYYCNRELYVDNWYSSPRLFLHLHQRGTYACGTVKSNRKGMPSFERLKRGETAAYASPPLLALKWQDKKTVLMLSTFHDDKIVPSNSVDYSTGLPKLKPQCVVDYTGNMGSVDTSDMMTSTLGCIRKSKKWHKKLGFHVIDMFMLNAFFLFKIMKNNTNCSFADFQLSVIRQLIEKYKQPAIIQPSTSRGIIDPFRFLHQDSLQHFPVKIPNRKSQRCKICASKKKRSETRFMCRKCNVYLCVDPCATEYHKTTGKIEESQSILADYSQDDVTDSQDVVIPVQSQLRSCDSTPDLYRSIATQTRVKTATVSTQYEQTCNPIRETARILADGYFRGNETLKNKFIESYINLVSTIIRLIDSD